jgi:uncharacterized protein YjbI with pentapeptide repeats
MANLEHLSIIKQGVEVWNQWRFNHIDTIIDLRGADLRNAELTGADLLRATLLEANFSGATLRNANLFEADLYEANLRGVDLSRADLRNAELTRANFSGANLSGGINLSGATLRNANLSDANLTGATLTRTDLRNANLTGANLFRVICVETNLTRANLTQCSIYGISAWNVQLERATQDNLVITRWDEPTITVDNLEVAQFIYLLLNNPKIRDVIDTIAKKAVLILGRFTPERKAILDALREVLRSHGYIPILFDFDKPASRDITETVSTLAHMARFVIADITDAKSIPQELMLIVPNLPSVPVQPLILTAQHEFGMFEHFTRYPWVLPVYHYIDEASLLQSLQEKIIAPAEQKAKELAKQ